jgi:iron complex transport system ATP-binding protein
MVPTVAGIFLREVCVERGGQAILSHIDMAVSPGQFVALVGPNGAGKSTLLRSISRGLRPSSGQIHIDGDALLDVSIHQLARRVAVLSQEHPTEAEFTVHEMVAMGRIPYRSNPYRSSPHRSDPDEHRQIIANSLVTVGMDGYEHRRFASLSGGERTRVLLARALAQEPDYLLLDEPTNHLDIRYQLELINLVQSLGVTVVAALHDLNVAAAHSDLIVMLDGGRVHLIGPPEEVFTPDNILRVFGVTMTKVAHPDNGRLQLLFGLPQ